MLVWAIWVVCVGNFYVTFWLDLNVTKWYSLGVDEGWSLTIWVAVVGRHLFTKGVFDV